MCHPGSLAHKELNNLSLAQSTTTTTTTKQLFRPHNTRRKCRKAAQTGCVDSKNESSEDLFQAIKVRVFICVFSFHFPPLGTGRVGDIVCRKIIWGAPLHRSIANLALCVSGGLQRDQEACVGVWHFCRRERERGRRNQQNGLQWIHLRSDRWRWSALLHTASPSSQGTPLTGHKWGEREWVTEEFGFCCWTNVTEFTATSRSKIIFCQVSNSGGGTFVILLYSITDDFLRTCGHSSNTFLNWQA